MHCQGQVGSWRKIGGVESHWKGPLYVSKPQSRLCLELQRKHLGMEESAQLRLKLYFVHYLHYLPHRFNVVPAGWRQHVLDVNPWCRPTDSQVHCRAKDVPSLQSRLGLGDADCLARNSKCLGVWYQMGRCLTQPLVLQYARKLMELQTW